MAKLLNHYSELFVRYNPNYKLDYKEICNEIFFLIQT